MTKTEKELIALKNLVKEFLKEVQYVPFRPVDCDQQRVNELIKKLEKALVEK